MTRREGPNGGPSRLVFPGFIHFLSKNNPIPLEKTHS